MKPMETNQSINADKVALMSLEIACVRFFGFIPAEATYNDETFDFKDVAMDNMTLNSAILFFLGITGKYVFNKDILEGLEFKVLYNDDGSLRFFAPSKEFKLSASSGVTSTITSTSSNLFSEYIELNNKKQLVMDNIFSFLEQVLLHYKDSIESLGCRFSMSDIKMGLDSLVFEREHHLEPNHENQSDSMNKRGVM